MTTSLMTKEELLPSMLSNLTQSRETNEFPGPQHVPFQLSEKVQLQGTTYVPKWAQRLKDGTQKQLAPKNGYDMLAHLKIFRPY